MNDTFMKTRPVFPLLLSMALPNVISMLVNSLYNIVDSLFVAQINEQAMTALSLVFPIQNFVSAVAIGFGIGINALVALYRGAGDHDRADAAATHGMALSVLHGILCTLAATAIMPGFLARFTTDGTIVSMGVTYSTIVFLFATVNMAGLAFEKIFQAVGRMKLTMIALISGCVCNILLDPVLIFGLGPVPAMGIAGAALGDKESVDVSRHRTGRHSRHLPRGLQHHRVARPSAPEGPAARPLSRRPSLRHRCACHPESGPALPAGHLPQRPAGGLLRKLCGGAGHLL